MPTKSISYGYGVTLRDADGNTKLIGTMNFPHELQMGSIIAIQNLICTVIEMDGDLGFITAIPLIAS